MGYLFNAIYASCLILGSPWLLWRYLRWGKNRRGWAQRLLGWVPRRPSNRPCIWFHAVSVGEVNLLAQVLTRLQQHQPNVEVVISTTTESGFDLARQKHSDLSVFFFPCDFTWAIRNALRRIRPSLIVLTELELWPNFIRIVDQTKRSELTGDMLERMKFVEGAVPQSTSKQEEACHTDQINVNETLKDETIPIVVLNGRLSQNSFRGYQKISRLVRSAFGKISLVMAQDETYAERFAALGIPDHRVVVTGSVKFDGVRTDRRNSTTTQLKNSAGISDDMQVVLAGSTQFEEDIVAATAFKNISQSHPSARLILAPRHPERCGNLIRALHDLGLTCQLRSQLDPLQRPAWSNPSCVLVIDVIGELGAWWGAADAAFVGGSLGGRRGGQNMLEPTAYGIPVSFGPNTDNFREIVRQLLESDAVTVVQNGADLEAFMRKALAEPDWAAARGSRAQKVVLQHDGAADRSVNEILALLPQSPTADQIGVRGQMTAA